MLTKTMIKAFIKIMQGHATTDALKHQLKIQESYCIKLLKAIQQEQLIILRKEGKVLYASLARTAHAQKLKELITRDPSIDYSNILDKNKTRVFESILYTSKTVPQIAAQLKSSTRTVHEIVKASLNRGLLKKRKKTYLFHKKFWPHLHEFLHYYRNRAIVKGTLLWQFEDEVLFEVRRKEDISGKLTGTSRYDDFSVKVVTSTYCCYQGKKRLSKEEIFVHSILQIEKDSRAVGLAAVFFKKNKLSRKKVKELALKYDCVNKVEELLSVITTKGKTTTTILPQITPKNLQRIYEIYGVY
ncbi:MAG: hypothetical protein KJ597_01460 [Nanoarchaeota archaeon]|nr:hypothetical protein [Nanoarchaeota archaeon]